MRRSLASEMRSKHRVRRAGPAVNWHRSCPAFHGEPLCPFCFCNAKLPVPPPPPAHCAALFLIVPGVVRLAWGASPIWPGVTSYLHSFGKFGNLFAVIFSSIFLFPFLSPLLLELLPVYYLFDIGLWVADAPLIFFSRFSFCTSIVVSASTMIFSFAVSNLMLINSIQCIFHFRYCIFHL